MESQISQAVLDSRRDGLVEIIRQCNGTLQRCQVATRLIGTYEDVRALLQSQCMTRVVRLPESAAFTNDAITGLRFLLYTLERRAKDQRNRAVTVLFADEQPAGSMERNDWTAFRKGGGCGAATPFIISSIFNSL